MLSTVKSDLTSISDELESIKSNQSTPTNKFQISQKARIYALESMHLLLELRQEITDTPVPDPLEDPQGYLKVTEFKCKNLKTLSTAFKDIVNTCNVADREIIIGQALEAGILLILKELKLFGLDKLNEEVLSTKSQNLFDQILENPERMLARATPNR